MSFNFDANLKSKLGIDFAALSAPYIQGSIPTEAIITAYDGGRTTIDVRGNLRSSNIDYAFLGFKKVSGTPASATALIEVDKDRQIKILISASPNRISNSAEKLISIPEMK